MPRLKHVILAASAWFAPFLASFGPGQHAHARFYHAAPVFRCARTGVIYRLVLFYFLGVSLCACLSGKVCYVAIDEYGFSLS
jgi:hypothetical protein